MFTRIMSVLVAAVLLLLSATPLPTFAADNAPGTAHNSKYCMYAGKKYSEGSEVKQAGTNKVCKSGEWITVLWANNLTANAEATGLYELQKCRQSALVVWLLNF
ncbi:MAG: hypothetical protein R2867_00480 [Caldilineaceae bacterium]